MERNESSVCRTLSRPQMNPFGAPTATDQGANSSLAPAVSGSSAAPTAPGIAIVGLASTEIDPKWRPADIALPFSRAASVAADLRPPVGHNAPLDPIWERRISKLETFPGDADLGYVRPHARAVGQVRRILSAIHRTELGLPAPAVSPAADGEVLVSWRSRGAYFILSFENEEGFDWVSNVVRPRAGTVSSADPASASPLAQVIKSMLRDGDRAVSYRRPPTGSS